MPELRPDHPKGPGYIDLVSVLGPFGMSRG